MSNYRDSVPENSECFAIACGIVLAFAALLRFRALGVSVFEDEVWVANLVRNGGWHPHSWSTPPLFYAIERGWGMLRGFSPARLREIPAFFGVALAAIPLLLNRGRGTRLVWSVLLAFSSPLLFYSTRIKQYTLEACVIALLIVLFLRAIESNAALMWIAFFALALLGVMTLYSPVFVIGGCALVTLFVAPRRLFGFALVFAAFAGAYFGYLAPGPESIRLHGDMTAFFTQHGRWVNSPASFVRNTMHFAGQMMNLVRFWWVAALAGVAFCIPRREEWAPIVIAIAPLAAVAVASIWRLYPYGEVRLMAFAFPALYLVIAAGFAGIANRTTIAGGAAIAVFLFVFAWQSVIADSYNTTYMATYDLRPLYDFVAANHRAGERVFANASLEPPLRYYHPELGSDLVRSDDAASPGWHVAFTRTSTATLALHIENAWASRVSAP